MKNRAAYEYVLAELIAIKNRAPSLYDVNSDGTMTPIEPPELSAIRECVNDCVRILTAQFALDTIAAAGTVKGVCKQTENAKADEGGKTLAQVGAAFLGR